MGGLCEEGHEFLRVCRKRNPEKTKHLIDVLVTQHSRWVASRMRRSLFGQATSTAVETCDHEQQQISCSYFDLFRMIVEALHTLHLVRFDVFLRILEHTTLKSVIEVNHNRGEGQAGSITHVMV